MAEEPEGTTPGERVLRHLAESGDVAAVSNLGRYLHLAGRRTEAVPLLRRAAEGGCAKAKAVLDRGDYDL